MGFDSLPLELVSRVLCLLAPRDVVRLRLVSKLFRDITRDPVLWKTIYANARVLRPPGPFPSQSTHFLEQTLIRSERLAECWTTQPLQALPNTLIRFEGLDLGLRPPIIILGRWLITLESSKQIVFHDIETHSRQVLWEDAKITSWDACSVTSDGGLLVYVIFHKDDMKSGPGWKLLESRVHDETGHVSHSMSFDVPWGGNGFQSYSRKHVHLISDHSPFLYITGHHRVFDMRTRIFYVLGDYGEFQGHREMLVKLAHVDHSTPTKVLLTNTHVIVLSYRLQLLPTLGQMPRPMRQWTIIHAYTLPADPYLGPLRLSHEGFISDNLANLALIRNSVIDSITESTNLRLLRLERDGLRFSCVDIMLPRPHPDTILPLSVKVNNIFAVESGFYDAVMSPAGYYIATSSDGYARGLCRNRGENGYPDRITRFTIDATGDECVADVGQALLPRWVPDEDSPYISMLTFDGITGKSCYIQDGCKDVVVVDIK